MMSEIESLSVRSDTPATGESVMEAGGTNLNSQVCVIHKRSHAYDPVATDLPMFFRNAPAEAIYVLANTRLRR